MVSHNHGNIAPLVPLAPQFHDAVFSSEQGFSGRRTKGADRLRTDGLQLAEEKLAADFHLVGQRCTVVGRTAFHYIADVNVAARKRDAFFLRGAVDHLCEQLTGTADKGDALLVLIGARPLPDEHESRLRVAGSED